MHTLSSLIGVNLLNPHAIPFAAPLVIAAFSGFIIGAIIVSLMDVEPVSLPKD